MHVRRRGRESVTDEYYSLRGSRRQSITQSDGHSSASINRVHDVISVANRNGTRLLDLQVSLTIFTH